MARRTVRLAVLCVATIVVCLTLYFTAVSSPRTEHQYVKPSPAVGHVMALHYAGQQGAGVRVLVSLQRWVKMTGLPMLIVEPFIYDSVLGTCGEYSQQCIKFSDLFDLQNFNRVSRNKGVAEIVPWDTYVTRAPSDAILVKMNRSPGPGPVPPPAVLWTAQPGTRECWPGQGGDADVWINNNRLCYVRVVLLSFQHLNSPGFSAKERAHKTILAGRNSKTVTIVFDFWRASWKAQKPHGVSPSHNSNVSKTSVFLSPMYRDSPKVLRDVEKYQKEFLRKSSVQLYVAVMLRAEHTLMMLNQRGINYNISAQLQNCLDELVNKTDGMMAKLGTQNVFVTADVGLYGSISWKKHNTTQLDKMEMQVKHNVERLYKNQWTFEQWENSFSHTTGGVEEKGYIAALQRGLASQASCLILLGGGEFQALALKGYVDRTKPNNRCINFVCMHENHVLRALNGLKDY